jgi:hypothetical protein
VQVAEVHPLERDRLIGCANNESRALPAGLLGAVDSDAYFCDRTLVPETIVDGQLNPTVRREAHTQRQGQLFPLLVVPDPTQRGSQGRHSHTHQGAATQGRPQVVREPFICSVLGPASSQAGDFHAQQSPDSSTSQHAYLRPPYLPLMPGARASAHFQPDYGAQRNSRLRSALLPQAERVTLQGHHSTQEPIGGPRTACGMA